MYMATLMVIKMCFAPFFFTSFNAMIMYGRPSIAVTFDLASFEQGIDFLGLAMKKFLEDSA